MKRIIKIRIVNEFRFIISVIIKMVSGFYIYNYIIIKEAKNNYNAFYPLFDDSSLFGVMLFFFIFYLSGHIIINQINRFDILDIF